MDLPSVDLLLGNTAATCWVATVPPSSLCRQDSVQKRQLLCPEGLSLAALQTSSNSVLLPAPQVCRGQGCGGCSKQSLGHDNSTSRLMRDSAAAADTPVPGTAADVASEKAEAARTTTHEELHLDESRLDADEAATATAPAADSRAELAGSSWRSLLRLDQQSELAAGDLTSKEDVAQGSRTASTLPEQEATALPVSGQLL